MLNLLFLVIVDVLIPFLHMGVGPRMKNNSTECQSTGTLFQTSPKASLYPVDDKSAISNKTATKYFHINIPKWRSNAGMSEKLNREWSETAKEGDLKNWKKFQRKFRKSNTSTKLKMIERSGQSSLMANERARKANVTARNAEIEFAQLEADVVRLEEEVKRLGSVARNASFDAGRWRTRGKVGEVCRNAVEAVRLENVMAQKTLLARNKEAEARYKRVEARQKKAEAERLAFQAHRKATELKWMESLIIPRRK